MLEEESFPPADPASDPLAVPPSGASAQMEGMAVPVPPSVVHDGGERKLDPRSVTAARVSGCIWLGILSVGLLVFLLFLLLTGAGSFWMMLSLGSGGGFLFVIAVLVWFWPPMRWRHASYQVNKKGFFMKEGVVWRSAVTVPRSRVQHTDVAQGPLQRVFGLATLVVYTAGTEHAFVSLRGLKPEDAYAIRDFLIDAGLDGDHDDAV